MNQKGFAPILIVLLIALGLGGYFIYSKYQAKPTSDSRATVSSPYPDSSPIIETQLLGKCGNDSLGIVLSIPEKWICKSSILSSTEGLINIQSDFFTIDISNLGRDPYCGDGPLVTTAENTCATSVFLLNNKVGLELYTFNGEDKEIFGGIVEANKKERDAKPWISIKYNDMEKQKLTSSQKTELVNLLDTIVVTK